jgi:hypothetical protein
MNSNSNSYGSNANSNNSNTANDSKLNKRLFRAIKDNDYNTALQLINQGADVNAIDEKTYMPPLYIATEKRVWKIFILLIQKGATIEYLNDDADSSAIVSLLNNLVDSFYDNTTTTNEDKEIAASAEPLKKIIELGFDPVDAFEDEGGYYTILTYLFSIGILNKNNSQHVKFLKNTISLLIDKEGVDKVFYRQIAPGVWPSALDFFWLNSLSEDEKFIFQPIIKHMIDKGVNISGKGNEIKNNPIVRIALVNALFENFEKLLNVYKGNGGKTVYGGSNLYEIIISNTAKLALPKLYIEAHGNKAKKMNEDIIFQILRSAALNEIQLNSNIVYDGFLKLVGRGYLSSGETILPTIFITYLVDMLPEKLIELRINGNTLLTFAIDNHILKVIKSFFARPEYSALLDALLNQKNEDGSTPLHHAALLDPNVGALIPPNYFKKGFKVIEMLIDAGADVSTVDAEGRTPYDIAAANNATERTLKALNVGGGAKYKGMSRGDIALLDDVLKPDGLKSLAQCPVCSELVNRKDACNYMTHNCKESAAHYHKGLFEKYKTPGGGIVFCIICGRICIGHAHYALGKARGPKTEGIFLEGADPFEADCRLTSGGGGLLEKLARFQKFRAVARDLQESVGKISDKKARDILVEAAWDAPLEFDKEAIQGILNSKAWNIGTNLFPANAAPAAVVAANYNNASKYSAPTISKSTAANNAGLYDEDEWIVRFDHVKGGASGGRLGDDHAKINKETLIGFLRSSPGTCFDPACGGLLWPAEVEAAITLFKENGVDMTETNTVVGNTRILADVSVVQQYRDRFNRNHAAGQFGGGVSQKMSNARFLTNSNSYKGKPLQLLHYADGVGCALVRGRSKMTRRQSKTQSRKTRSKKTKPTLSRSGSR